MRRALTIALILTGIVAFAQTPKQSAQCQWVYRNVAYEHNPKMWYQAQAPKETLTRLKGNCVDMSTCLIAILKAWHLSAKPELIIVSVPWSKGAHAMVEVESGFLDPTNGCSYATLPAGYKIIETHTL